MKSDDPIQGAATNGKPRTHRSQFGIYRIPTREPGEQRLDAAIRSIWNALACEIGREAACKVGLGNVSIEENRAIVRFWTPVEHADRVAAMPMIFDDEGWRNELQEIAWSKPDQKNRESRRAALAAFREDVIDPDDAAQDEYAASMDTKVEHDPILLRFSVPWVENPKHPNSGRSYADIVAFIKENYKGLLRNSPRSMLVVGLMRQPTSTSLVIEIPRSAARRIDMKSRHVRITEFSKRDFDKIERRSAEGMAITLGCNVYYTREERSANVAITGIEYTTAQKMAMIRDAITPKPILRPMAIATVDCAWRMLTGALELFCTVFHMTDAPGRPGIASATTPAIADRTKARNDVWKTLGNVLPEHLERIEACEKGCLEFERVSTRWGDTRSAETSASVIGLLDRISNEMADMVEWSSTQEAADAARDTLATLERLAARAEEERIRLVSGLRGRLDTTRRFVEMKLDDSELTSIPDLRQAS